MMYVENCMIVYLIPLSSSRSKESNKPPLADCVGLHRYLKKSLLMNAHISIFCPVLILFYFAIYHLFIVTVLWGGFFTIMFD